MKWKVLVSAPYMQPVLDRFSDIFTQRGIELLVPPVRERLSEEELLQLMGEIDGAICGDDQFTEKVLRLAPRLKVISKWGTGIDSIDLAAARQLGIAVRNTPDAFTRAVADTVLGYILCFARQIPWLDRDVHKGYWRKLPARALHECSLGVIGVGCIGKAVVIRAKAFGMSVMGNDLIDMPPGFVEETGINMVSMEKLLKRCDFVSLNCDLNPTSYHLISKNELGIMKNSSVLINTARGPIIDEPVLIHALQNNQIAGAALDVFEIEPLPIDSPLRQMDNVLLATHNANSSPEAWERIHQNTIKNLLEELDGKSTWNE